MFHEVCLKIFLRFAMAHPTAVIPTKADPKTFLYTFRFLLCIKTVIYFWGKKITLFYLSAEFIFLCGFSLKEKIVFL